MENLILTQLSVPELKELFRETLDSYFAEKQTAVAQPNADEIGGIELAVRVTGKAKATIYNLCSNRGIPHWKQGRQLYFSKNELLQWLRDGKRKTQTELAYEAENFTPEKSQQSKNVAPR